MHNLLNVSGQYLGAIIITHKQKEEKYHHIVHEKDHVNTISLFKVRNCRGGGKEMCLPGLSSVRKEDAFI